MKKETESLFHTLSVLHMLQECDENSLQKLYKKLAGYSSVEMTDYYTRAAIPEMVAALESAKPAADTLFE